MNIASRETAEKNVLLFSEGYYNNLQSDNVCRRLDEKVVDFNYDERTITLEFEIGEWMANPIHTLHGGMFAMAADMTAGALSRILCDVFAPTLSFDISYHRPAKVGDTLVSKGYAIHLGRTNAHIRTEIRSKNTGELLATSTAIHFVAGVKRPIQKEAEVK